MSGTLTSVGSTAAVSWSVHPVQISDEPGAFLITLGLFFLGLILIYFGFQSYRTSRLIRDTPTSKVRSMPVGRVELQGTARDAGETLDAPFTDDECLYVSYKIEEYEYDRKDEEWEWVTKASGTERVPFYLEDDTGKVYVDATDRPSYPLSGAMKTRIRTKKRGDTPREVRNFIRSETSIGLTNNKRRYTQEIIPVDEEVYVFGGATQREEAEGSNAERLKVETDDMTGRFIVSDREAGALAKAYGRKAPLLMLLGLGISAICLYVILEGAIFV